MPEVTLVAKARETRGGSRAAGRLRADDMIPAVVYGRGSEARPVTVARRELRQVLTGDAGMNALINLDVDGDTLLTIVRDVQRHPVRNNVTHVDFILVSRDEAVTVEVPIALEGEAAEVLRHDGTVDQQMFTLTVQAKPGNIPNELTLDISSLDIGDTLRVGDLRLPTGATTEVDPEEPVVVASFNAAAAEVEALDAEVAEEAAAEAADEAEAEAAEGADAEDGDGSDAAASAGGDAPADGDAEG
jgi:large subunit ribosomal protein L25